MNNYIERFKQKTKSSLCENNSLNGVIFNSTSSTIVYHVRLQKEIPVSLIFKHEEGVDDAVIYSLPKDDLRNGDYFIYNHTYYLVIKKQSSVFTDGKRNLHSAVECNVKIKVRDIECWAAFYGSMRKAEKLSSRQNTDNSGFNYQNLQYNNLIIVPSALGINTKDKFLLEEKQWRIAEIDSTSNKGIAFISVAYDLRTLEEKVPEFEDGNNEENLDLLHWGLSYTFNTENYYFESDIYCEIAEREKNFVTIKIPFNINSLQIKIKENGNIVTKEYKVGV